MTGNEIKKAREGRTKKEIYTDGLERMKIMFEWKKKWPINTIWWACFWGQMKEEEIEKVVISELNGRVEGRFFCVG